MAKRPLVFDVEASTHKGMLFCRGSYNQGYSIWSVCEGDPISWVTPNWQFKHATHLTRLLEIMPKAWNQRVSMS